MEHLQHLEHRNQQLQEQLHPTTASQQPGQPAAYDGSLLPQQEQAVARERALLSQLQQSEARESPLIPVVEEGSGDGRAGGGNPLPERLRATQATEGQGSAGVLQSLLSGIRGVRDRSRSPGAEFVDNGGMNAADGRRESRSTPVLAQGTGVLDALACGVQQLQELQAQALQKGESSPEAIRQTIPPFPMLKGPSGDQSGLQLQDWLDLVASNAADVSENSSSWWDQVRDFVQGVYATWLRSTLLEGISCAWMVGSIWPKENGVV